MVDLKIFFIENEKNDYWKIIEKNLEIDFLLNQDNYQYVDDTEVINKFKGMLEPKTVNDNKENEQYNLLYFLICFYLNENGYVINEFPDNLARPTKYYDFGYTKIRDYLIKEGKTDTNNNVAWETRRKFVNELKIIKKTKLIDLDDGLSNFVNNSPSIKHLNDAELDNRIRKMIILFEELTKNENGKFIEIDYEKAFLGVITEKQYLNFKKKLYGFKHSFIGNTKKYTDAECEFLCNMGITILNKLYDYLKDLGFIKS